MVGSCSRSATARADLAGQLGDGRRARGGRLAVRARRLPRARGGDRHRTAARRAAAVARRAVGGLAGAAPDRYTLWVAATTLTDADIVVGEARQIVFINREALGGLALSESAAHFLPAFLASPDHADLPGEA